MAEAICPAKPKIVTLWPLKKKFPDSAVGHEGPVHLYLDDLARTQYQGQCRRLSQSVRILK